jgi:molybdate transport system substrate-binding protein
VTLRAFVSRVAAGLLAAALSAQAAWAQEMRVTVFAAASLQTALDAVAAAWHELGGGEAVISYAATSALARQIEQGAPADIFISADLDWMAYLAERGLTRIDTTTNLLGNRLVLVAPADAASPVEITPSLDLVGMLGGGRLAVANTEAVPAGRYARAALESLGLWQGVAGHLAEAENVRAALAFVSRGEAPLGIVYASDDVADPTVEAVGVFPEDSHPPIIYPATIVADSDNPAAAAFLAFLRSTTAQCIFEAQGFTVFAADGEPAPPVACNRDG